MKNIVLVSLLFIFSCASKTVKKISINNPVNEKDNLYQVYKLDTINSFYIIYLEKDSKKYKVVSKKTNNNKCKRIEEGKTYSFNLTSILEQKIKLGDKEFSSSNSLMVNCFYFDEKTKICKEESVGIYDLFKTDNLQGLCYIKALK